MNLSFRSLYYSYYPLEAAGQREREATPRERGAEEEYFLFQARLLNSSKSAGRTRTLP